MSRADALKPSQINRVLKTCKLMQHSQSKRCALVLSHAAMRVTEIALLQTKTILYPSGQLREEIHLPAKICKFCKPRTIWLTNPKTRQIIQEWIDYRRLKRWGTTLDDMAYQGLNPESKFVLSNRGRGYSLQPKPRLLGTGEVREYWACDALEAQIRDIYKRCGLSHCSSHTGRKSLVTNSVIAGVPLEQMARVLGHADKTTTVDYVVIQQDRIKEMCCLDWI